MKYRSNIQSVRTELLLANTLPWNNSEKVTVTKRGVRTVQVPPHTKRNVHVLETALWKQYCQKIWSVHCVLYAPVEHCLKTAFK